MNTVKHKGLNLPAPHTRINEGVQDNEAYIQSGVEQIEHLIQLGLIWADTIMLDFGCGQGRIANALQFMGIDIDYYGIDTDLDLIRWCKDNLTFGRFLWVSSKNRRYNAHEKELRGIPNDDNYFTLIFLNSVFSHMLQDDVSFYLDEFYRVLKPGGAVYLTGFIEHDVPDCEENPPGYMGMTGNDGPLLRVRYNKEYFLKLCKSAGFEVEHFFHRHIKRTRQSVVVLRK